MWLTFTLASPFTTGFHSSVSLPKMGYCKVFLLLYHLLLSQVTRYTGKDICCLCITLMQTKINSYCYKKKFKNCDYY